MNQQVAAIGTVTKETEWQAGDGVWKQAKDWSIGVPCDVEANAVLSNNGGAYIVDLTAETHPVIQLSLEVRLRGPALSIPTCSVVAAGF